MQQPSRSRIFVLFDLETLIKMKRDAGGEVDLRYVEQLLAIENEFKD
ncbi:MAG: hypothetical protein AAF236_13850 [Verrucomicrobiota bacterium]